MECSLPIGELSQHRRAPVNLKRLLPVRAISGICGLVVGYEWALTCAFSVIYRPATPANHARVKPIQMSILQLCFIHE